MKKPTIIHACLPGSISTQFHHQFHTLFLTSCVAIFQLYLSRQLAQLHPELTMPMFSEICHRLQTARLSKIKCLLYYLLPWLYNMELVDGAATAANTSVNQDVPPSANVAGKQEAEQAGQQLLN